MGKGVHRFCTRSVCGCGATRGRQGDAAAEVEVSGRMGASAVVWFLVPFLSIVLFSEPLLAQVGTPQVAKPPAAKPQAAKPQVAAPPAQRPDAPPTPGLVRLAYSLGKGTAGCDGEVMFRRLVASETNQPDPFVLKGTATHELDIGILRDAPGFRTIIELRRADGTVLDHHEYAERTCADAVDRAVISVMLAVFPAPAQPQEEAPKGGAPSADVTRECDECAVRSSRAEREVRELEGRISVLSKRVDALEGASGVNRRKKGDMDLSFALSAGALLTANLTSNVGPGVWIGADARVKVISVGIELRAVLPSPVFLGNHDLDYSQFLAHVTPCGRYSYFFGCVVAGAGMQVLADTNFVSSGPNSGIFPALQLGGRLGAEVPFGDSPVGARLWGEVLYTNPRTDFSYVAEGLKWQRPDVSAFFGLGLVFFLGSKEAT